LLTYLEACSSEPGPASNHPHRVRANAEAEKMAGLGSEWIAMGRVEEL